MTLVLRSVFFVILTSTIFACGEDRPDESAPTEEPAEIEPKAAKAQTEPTEAIVDLEGLRLRLSLANEAGVVRNDYRAGEPIMVRLTYTPMIETRLPCTMHPDGPEVKVVAGNVTLTELGRTLAVDFASEVGYLTADEMLRKIGGVRLMGLAASDPSYDPQKAGEYIVALNPRLACASEHAPILVVPFAVGN